MPSFGVAIVTYNGPKRVEALLGSITPKDREVLDQIIVSEDPCPYPEVHDAYVHIAGEFNVPLFSWDNWGCMQGNAINAMSMMKTDIVALLSDDILLTPGCLVAVKRFWEKYWHFPIGLGQIAYWGNWTDLIGMGFIGNQEEFYTKWPSYIAKVPRNTFWDYDGYPRLYVNVHGSGFAVRRDVWNAVYGVSREHWSYDEDLAFRVWTASPNVVCTIPGPPFVHMGGASQCGNEHPDCRYDRLDSWIKAWECDKPTMHAVIRQKMAQRAYIDEEFRKMHMTPKARLDEELQRQPELRVA